MKVAESNLDALARPAMAALLPLRTHLAIRASPVCPACGEKDHERLELLTGEGRERERIHGCRSCHHYVLVIDLVESSEKLHPDLAPLGLIPLDVWPWKKAICL